MIDFDAESTLYRVLTGYYYIYIDNSKYKILLPNIHDKYLAHNTYLSIINDYKYEDGWITEKNISSILNVYNIWNDTKEKYLNDSKELLDKTKIQYFLNFNTASVKPQIKNSIDNLNKTINGLYNEKYSLNYLTLENYAQNIKNQILVSSMIYNDDNVRVFEPDIDNIDSDLLEKFIREIYNNSLGQEAIKKLARHEIWRSYWGSNKDKIFSGSVVDWTDEQRSLVNFTRTLDSIREHLEAPEEEIINDDDALDGWMLYQHEKAIKEKKQKHITEKYGLNNKNGQEVFILANNQEEAKEIFSLNDRTTMREIKEMKQVVNKSDELINWAELPHVKRELKTQAMSVQKERFRSQ